jgi:anthranilate phosphoribosyltransferase
VSGLASALASLAAQMGLTAEETRAAVAEIIAGDVPEPLIAAFLTGLRVKGESPEELAGAVLAVRERMLPLDVPPHCRPLLDTCGTGGDRAGTVNVSTAAALVAAACGVKVAKHGNRSASGNSGSAEVLVELGVNIDAGPEQAVRCLEEAGIAFLFAPKFHPALKHAAPVRRLLPFRTLFNLVGPLANPARPEYQLLGVPSLDLIGLVASAWRELAPPSGSRVAVLCGDGSLDEVSPSGQTLVAHLSAEAPPRDVLAWTPTDFGLGPVDVAALRVSGPAESASRIRAMLDGEPGPVRDIVLANAAAALLVAGRVSRLGEGVQTAAEAVARGDARRLLELWSRLSHRT